MTRNMTGVSEDYLEPLMERLIEESRIVFAEKPDDTESQRRLVRSLMNVRMPVPIPADIQELQDKYLGYRNAERGIAHASDISTIDISLDSSRPCADRISLWQGDITTLDCDAIVNAANSQMLGCFQPCHACIDNCIHTYAGMQLRLECDRQMKGLKAEYGRDYEQPTSVPMVTEAYNLPSEKVIHVVGPIVYGDLTEHHERMLAQCYHNVLEACRQNGIRSVAFCCISTGVFRFPNDRAAEIAVDTVTEWLREDETMEKVIFNVFLDKDRDIYERLLG